MRQLSTTSFAQAIRTRAGLRDNLHSSLMVRVGGLEVTEGEDERYHSTKADYRQASLGAVQLPPFNAVQICGEEGDPHSLRSTALLLHCETDETVSLHLRIVEQQAPAVSRRDT